jgi:hypothetical protein
MRADAGRRDARIPSCTDAWTSSSYSSTSPGWGTVLKKETLASHPLLKRRPAGAAKCLARRVSRAVCAHVPPLRRREPVEPRTVSAAARRARYAARRAGSAVRLR